MATHLIVSVRFIDRLVCETRARRFQFQYSFRLATSMSSEEEDIRSPQAKRARTDSIRSLRRRRSFPRTDLKLCLFCQSEKRDRRNRRIYEKLVRCEGESTPITLVNSAEIRGDERILLEIQGQDLWAKDVLYHRSCYQSFTSPRAFQIIADRAVEDKDDLQPFTDA